MRTPLRHEHRGHQLVGCAGGAPVAKHELAERERPHAAHRRELHLGAERKQGRHAIGRGRSVAEVARDGPCVLNLDATDFPRGELHRFEPPGNGAATSSLQVASAPMRHCSGRFAHAAQVGERSDVEDVLVDRSADAGGKEVGAAGEHRARPGARARNASSRTLGRR